MLWEMASVTESFQILYNYPEPAIENLWRCCLAKGDMPTHFASPEFFLEPSNPAEKRFAVLALSSGAEDPQVTGVLTGVIRSGELVSGQIGTPQVCMLAGASGNDGGGLVEGLLELGKEAKLINVFTWSPIEALRRKGFKESQETGTAALDIGEGPEKTFKRLKGRSQIRHAISAGVEVRQARQEDVPEYYSILKDWSGRKELPCPSFDFIKESFSRTGNRRLFVAIYEGKIIAGTPVRFYAGGTAEYAWNASLPEYQHLRPNDLLHWRIIEWACEQGIHTYLLGATHTFLLKYSDRIIPTYRYSADRTFFKTHALKERLLTTAVDVYRGLPPEIRTHLKKLRG